MRVEQIKMPLAAISVTTKGGKKWSYSWWNITKKCWFCKERKKVKDWLLNY